MQITLVNFGIKGLQTFEYLIVLQVFIIGESQPPIKNKMLINCNRNLLKDAYG